MMTGCAMFVAQSPHNFFRSSAGCSIDRSFTVLGPSARHVST